LVVPKIEGAANQKLSSWMELTKIDRTIKKCIAVNGDYVEKYVYNV